jgi:hypothetical protein
VLDQAGDVVLIFDDKNPVFGHGLRARGAITEDTESYRRQKTAPAYEVWPRPPSTVRDLRRGAFHYTPR